jgi:hypothetical protein
VVILTGELEELLKEVRDKDTEAQKYECLALAEGKPA